MRIDGALLFDIAAASLLIIVGIMMFFYVSKYMSEGICGGQDQRCGCCGNENFTHKEITSNDLSKVAMGMSV